MTTPPAHDAPLSRELAALLARGVADGAFPAASAFVAQAGTPRAVAAAGAAHPETWFDLASLTKPVAVGTLVAQLASEGALDLDAPCAHPSGAGLTVRALLGHTSGLPALDDLPAHLDATFGAWTPGAPETRSVIEARVSALARQADPSRGVVYSDLGYILLGWHLERALGRPLPALVRDRVGFRGHFGGVAPPADPARYAPTGVCPRRGRRLFGEVNDLNAWALGGVAGHAGLFATAEAVGAWALDLERRTETPGDPLGATLRAFWDPAARPHDAPWVLGWTLPSPGASSAGTRVPLDAIGHLGFTGTSVWIDRRHRLVVVLLTNRVDRGPGSEVGIKAFRPWFHDAVRDLLGLP